MNYENKLKKSGFEIINYSTKITGIIKGIEYFITDKNKRSRDYEPEFKASYNNAKKMGLI